MSMEWARARALENEARLRDRIAPTDRTHWLEFTMIYPASFSLWLEAPHQPLHGSRLVSDSRVQCG